MATLNNPTEKEVVELRLKFFNLKDRRRMLVAQIRELDEELIKISLTKDENDMYVFERNYFKDREELKNKPK
jgi:hypothetical protein